MSTSWRCDGKEKSEEKRDILSPFSLPITSCYRRVRYAQRRLGTKQTWKSLFEKEHVKDLFLLLKIECKGDRALRMGIPNFR